MYSLRNDRRSTRESVEKFDKVTFSDGVDTWAM